MRDADASVGLGIGKYRRGLPLLAACGLALGLRLYALGRYPLDGDEIFSIKASAATWGNLISIAINDKSHPPLFYAILKLWLLLVPAKEIWARLPSVLFGTALIPVTFGICRKLRLAEADTVLVILVIAVNSELIFYAQQARMFPLFELSSALSILAFIYFLESRISWAAACAAESSKLADGVFPLLGVAGDWCTVALRFTWPSSEGWWLSVVECHCSRWVRALGAGRDHRWSGSRSGDATDCVDGRRHCRIARLCRAAWGNRWPDRLQACDEPRYRAVPRATHRHFSAASEAGCAAALRHSRNWAVGVAGGYSGGAHLIRQLFGSSELLGNSPPNHDNSSLLCDGWAFAY